MKIQWMKGEKHHRRRICQVKHHANMLTATENADIVEDEDAAAGDATGE